jgi:cobyrinic acid a,c-diamide synthase
MSIPRVLLAPTHHTGLADAVAAAVAEIVTARGQAVRYHHLGPLSPTCCWDRWEGAAFLDPALYGEGPLLGLYDVATRGASLSLLSSTSGVFDRQDGVAWLPADMARLLDCPVVVLIDCRGWGTGIRALATGLKAHMDGVNLAGAVLSGVTDREHLALLRSALASEDVPVVGCLFEGDGPGWETGAPGAWGLPLEASVLEAVSRQVDVDGLISIAGQRGFLSWQNWFTDRGADGPVIAVAAGKGFTPWSRDSIEVLRSAGAEVRRLDLVEHSRLPPGTAGLILAGTLWPGAVLDIAMNTALLEEIGKHVAGGLPTLALGGGTLLLVDKVQDSLGRRSDLAAAVPATGEILWDLEKPVYVEMTSRCDSVLLARGESITGWVLTEAEITNPGEGWMSPFSVPEEGMSEGHPEGAASGSLLCSRVLLHLAATPEAAPRFVRRCAEYAALPR